MKLNLRPWRRGPMTSPGSTCRPEAVVTACPDCSTDHCGPRGTPSSSARSGWKMPGRSDSSRLKARQGLEWARG